jgi:hypothetical protein
MAACVCGWKGDDYEISTGYCGTVAHVQGGSKGVGAATDVVNWFACSAICVVPAIHAALGFVPEASRG